MSTLADTLRDAATALVGDRTSTQVLVVAAATVAITAAARRALTSSTIGVAHEPLPPSPPAWPLVGHLPLLATTNRPDELIQQLAREYGPVFSLKLGNVDVIVISNQELAQETLVKRGRIYAGRWVGKVLSLGSEGGRDLVMAPYGERWSHLRRVAHRILTPLKLTQLDARLDAESLRFVRYLASTAGEPVEVKRHLMLYTANIMSAKCLGITYDSPDDPALRTLCNGILKIFELGGVGGIEDYFDSGLLDWIAMWHKRREIKAVRARVHDGMVWDRILELKARLDEEQARGVDPRAQRDLCYAEELILSMDEDQLTMNDIKQLMLDFLFAGMDTTAATLLWTFVYLINDPTHQTRLQAEVDAIVTTHGRLPSLDDFEDLPYTRAVIKEVTRVSPVTPLGVPRQTTAADTLAGYHIPANAQVIYNIVGIHESTYDADFRPDRWIESGSLALMDGLVTFGAGRRMCPGVHLAAREAVLLLARTMASVQLGNAKGNGVKFDMAATFGLTNLPQETVLIKATVRGLQARSLVENDAAALRDRAEDNRDVAETAE
ncbi:cytochrome P450 2 sub U member 1 [Allomyces arbusculus]|nr:cytochrome P450 2 sub U member 1 [Allomyces arbusculus]